MINQLTTGRKLRANVNPYGQDGKTPLLFAAQKGLCAAVLQLVSLGANPNAAAVSCSSLLQKVHKYRDTAKKASDFSLYADILECEDILVSLGTVKQISPLIEFESNIEKSVFRNLGGSQFIYLTHSDLIEQRKSILQNRY